MAKTSDVVKSMCRELGVDVKGLSADDLDIVGLRIVAEDVPPTKANVERVIADVVGRGEGVPDAQAMGTSHGGYPAPSPLITVERAEGRGQATGVVAPQEPALPSAPIRKPRYLATEATDAKYRERLARAHRTEDARTGLYLVPRRPERMRAGAVHPACKAAYADEGVPCEYCTPLLHPAICACPICEEWWARMDA